MIAGLVIVGLSLNAAGFTRVSPCDLAGHDLGGAGGGATTEASAEPCETRCAARSGCEAFVYISGWRRCFLKGPGTKVVSVRFYAGVIRDGKIADAGFDQDFSGKDLRRVEHVASGELCAKECEAEPGCKAFAYIGGYADCWLKKDVGNRREKVFSCGIKSH